MVKPSASLNAVQRFHELTKKDHVDPDHRQQVLNSLNLWSQRGNFLMPEEQRHLVAMHEAGHAVAAMLARITFADVWVTPFSEAIHGQLDEKGLPLSVGYVGPGGHSPYPKLKRKNVRELTDGELQRFSTVQRCTMLMFMEVAGELAENLDLRRLDAAEQFAREAWRSDGSLGTDAYKVKKGIWHLGRQLGVPLEERSRDLIHLVEFLFDHAAFIFERPVVSNTVDAVADWLMVEGRIQGGDLFNDFWYRLQAWGISSSDLIEVRRDLHALPELLEREVVSRNSLAS